MITKRAIFEVGDATRVHAAWFAGGAGWDCVAMLMREGDGLWRVTMRMRHDGAPGEDDSKSVTEFGAADPSMPVAMMAAHVDAIMRASAAATGATVERLQIDGGADELTAALLASPWCHVMMTGKGGDA